MARKKSSSKYEMTPFELKLFCGALFFWAMNLIVFLFLRGDGSYVRDLAGGRTYAIAVHPKGTGRTWYLWVDHAGWVIYHVVNWSFYSATVVLVISVAFHSYRKRWRAQNEGRPQQSPEPE